MSNTVEEKAKLFIKKLKGKSAKPLPDLLREYHLPSGLFPRNITCYEFDNSSRKLVVHLPNSASEVCFKDSSVLRYSSRVKATLARGKLTAVEGMKSKAMVWVKVSGVTVDSYRSDKVCFVTAGVKKSRDRDAYEVAREAVQVEQF